MHSVIPLTKIVIVVLMALVCGGVFTRIKQPAILGYVLSGVILGPYLVNDPSLYMLIKAFAELGVFMLLFTLGVDMNLRFFKESWLTTLGCITLQLLFSCICVYLVSLFFNWSIELVICVGTILSFSSTAVAIKILESMGLLKTETGHLAISILIAQDLAFVPVVLLIQSFGAGEHLVLSHLFLKLFVSIGFLVGLIFFLTRTQRVILPFSKQVSNPDLLPILTLGFCFGLAALTSALGLSACYGAFLAGLVLGNTAQRHEVTQIIHPIQTLLLMVFFLSIGLLIDLSFIWQHIYLIAVLMLITTLGKTILNAAILHWFNYKWTFSFVTSLVLAQIGEFSFVLSDVAFANKVIAAKEYKLITSLTVLSLAFSSIWTTIARKLQSSEAMHIFYKKSIETSLTFKEKVQSLFKLQKDDSFK